MTFGRFVRSKAKGAERMRVRYMLDNAWDVELPAIPRKGDRITIRTRKRGLLPGSTRRATIDARVSVDAGVDGAALEAALDVLSAELLGPKCKGFVLRDTGELVVGLDVDLYADLKDRLGYGHTALPLDPNEQFHHGRFLFCIVASHAWQRPRDPTQPLS